MTMSELIPSLSAGELAEIDAEIAHVPYRAAVAIDALKIVQRHRGWVSDESLRAIARHFELECWERPASPCLSSRIPYFQEITTAKLEQVEAGENLLADRGFAVSRVRHHGKLARIEVPREQVQKQVAVGGGAPIQADPVTPLGRMPSRPVSAQEIGELDIPTFIRRQMD